MQLHEQYLAIRFIDSKPVKHFSKIAFAEFSKIQYQYDSKRKSDNDNKNIG